MPRKLPPQEVLFPIACHSLVPLKEGDDNHRPAASLQQPGSQGCRSCTQAQTQRMITLLTDDTEPAASFAGLQILHTSMCVGHDHIAN